MALVATASTTVRNKNVIMVAMCLVFTIWFAYDGWWGYAKANDQMVKTMVTETTEVKTRDRYSPDNRETLEHWPGWEYATASQRDIIAALAHEKGHEIHSDLSITVQKWLVLGLALASAAAIWWFLKCQRRRATADDQTLSPAPGLSIPWAAITKVDNTHWKKKGIVNLDYLDAAGQPQTTFLDDYLLDDLLPILDLLSERAEKAQFINPEVVEKTDPSGPSPDPSKPQP